MDRLFIGGRASRPCTNTAPTPAQARLLVSRGPCRAFKGRLSARFVESTHSLERQPAQAGLRVDLGARERTENVAAVHTQTPESSHRRRSSSRQSARLSACLQETVFHLVKPVMSAPKFTYPPGTMGYK